MKKEEHQTWQIIHRDLGDCVVELCCVHFHCYRKILKGKEAKLWQERLSRIGGD